MLRFPPAFESAFQREYFRKSLRPVRLVLCLGTLLYGVCFVPFDYWFLPFEIFKTVTAIRLGTAVFLLGLFAFTFSARFEQWWQLTMAGAIVIVAASVALMTAVNPPDSAFAHVVAPAFLLYLMITFTVARLRFLYATVTGLILLGIYNAAMLWTGAIPLSLLFGNNMMLFSAVVLGMAAAYLLERYVRSDYLHVHMLEAEQKRSESLLLNILPRAIATRLKLKPGTIAESFPEVTILFADICGFTALAARRSPEETVELLNTVFSAFDRLAEAHDLEKIKTVGDAYMVVGGLPTPRADHAEAIATLALDMQTELAKLNQQTGEALALRIGIHTGAAVAGVIGTKKFSYDLWGDSVNTASRMQSHGLADHVQITEDTRWRLGDGFECQERGVIEVKGKGAIRTYFLLGRKRGRSPFAIQAARAT